MQQAPGWKQASVTARRLHPVTPLPPPVDGPVARNKVSTRCFWNACKALSCGLLFMLIGTAMATVGYFADQLEPPLVRTNSSVTRSNKGLHLHNLSYAGPIVMGIGGFVVVAACVMTFEARDSAAKVVPTRLKYASAHGLRHSKLSPASMPTNLQSSVRSGAAKWDQTQVYRVAGPTGSPAASDALDRRALTQAFIQFSRNLQQAGPSQPAITKSPSAPNLADTKPPTPVVSPFFKSHISPQQRQKRSRNSSRPPGCTLLNCHALLPRQALSMDNPDYNPYFSPPRSQQLTRQHSDKGSKESLEMDLGAMCQAHGSQASMVMDLHLPNDCPVTLRVKDRTKRSDTAKRHAFVRQTQIVDDDATDRRDAHSCSPRLPGYHQRAYDEIRPYSRSTPHSRRESLTRATVTKANTEDHSRSRSNTSESRRSSTSKAFHSRTNTEERKRRRDSNTSEQRKSGNVSRSSSYETRWNLEGQSSTCSDGRSDVLAELGSNLTSDELNKKSETYIAIDDVDVNLQVLYSCPGAEDVTRCDDNAKAIVKGI